jgi:hypothetical protein
LTPAGAGGGIGPNFNVDDFNRMQIAAREGKTHGTSSKIRVDPTKTSPLCGPP